jgi:catechol 2,3-dioxygenase-like lactoylglutathione lyase family enzyme
MTAITHVGVTVTDLDRAVEWYGSVLGLEPIGAPVSVRAHEGHAGAMAADVLGPDFGSFRQAHVVGSNGVALELFEFARTPARRGIFHLCVVAPEVGRTAERIVEAGGRRTSREWQIFEHEPYRMAYCEDPFGNTVELYSHSHERTYANR